MPPPFYRRELCPSPRLYRQNTDGAPVDPLPHPHRAPEAGEAEPVRFRVGELEEVRCRDETASFREVPPLGAEIDDRRSLRPRRRKAPAQLHQLAPLLPPAKNGCGFGRPDIVARLKIGVTGRFVQNCTLAGMRITIALRHDFESEF